MNAADTLMMGAGGRSSDERRAQALMDLLGKTSEHRMQGHEGEFIWEKKKKDKKKKRE